MWQAFRQNDPFDVFRTVLFVAVSAYYLAVTVATVVQMTVLLSGNEPHKRMLRSYMAYALLSFRIRPLLGEIVPILFWILALVLLWYGHQVLDVS
jgi:hypothetical protein